MDSIPGDSIVLLVLVDTLLAMGASAFAGCLLAFTIDRPMRIGFLVGAALPFVGPLGWAVRASQPGYSIGRPVTRLDGRLRWALGVGLALPALAYIIAAGMPWAGVEGSVKGYAALGEASPLDSVVGALALGMGAIVLIGCAVTLVWASPLRVSALVVATGGFWLAMTLDTLIVFAAVNHLAANVAGMTDGGAEGHVYAGSGTWTVLAASVVALAVGLVLGVYVTRRSTLAPVVAAESARISTAVGDGDSF